MNNKVVPKVGDKVIQYHVGQYDTVYRSTRIIAKVHKTGRVVVQGESGQFRVRDNGFDGYDLYPCSGNGCALRLLNNAAQEDMARQQIISDFHNSRYDFEEYLRRNRRFISRLSNGQLQYGIAQMKQIVKNIEAIKD